MDGQMTRIGKHKVAFPEAKTSNNLQYFDTSVYFYNKMKNNNSVPLETRI
jgi:hypothetical protein